MNTIAQGAKIGELASTTGLTPKTIRYYEALGLLSAPSRTESGYRIYGPQHLERLEFIKKAKRLGLSLGEIMEVIRLRAAREVPCIHVLALIEKKMAEIDQAISDLTAFRGTLAQLHEESVRRLDELGSGAAVCGVIEQDIHLLGEGALTWLETRRLEKAARESR